MITRFEIAHGVGLIPNSVLVYRPEEYSFDLEPGPTKRFTSILINDLNLEVDEAGRVIAVWGLCPHTRWTETRLIAPPTETGVLFAISDRPLLPGVSVRLDTAKYLPTYVDRSTGWVRVKGEPASAASVMVFPGVIIDIGREGQFSSIWLHPRQGIPK